MSVSAACYTAVLKRLFPLLALSVAGCTGPMPQLAATDVPAAWQLPGATPAWPAKDWWQGFNSADLNALIATASDKNLDLAAAQARLLQADARARQAGAGLYPTLDLNGNALHQIGVKGGTTAHDSTIGAGLGASYELDLFGKNRDVRDSADAQVKVSLAQRQSTAIAVVTDTANTYFLLLSLRERLALTRSNLKVAQDLANIVEQKVGAGSVPGVDLVQQRTVAATQSSLLAQLEQQELATRDALSVLLGRPPEGFDVAAKSLEDLATPVPAPGMPSDLLLRRPDIVAAESDLESAHADLAAARAAFFPTISLTGSAGYQSPALAGAITSLPGPGGLFTLGASLVQNIFDAGKLTAKSDEARAREQELLANYRKAVISAFSDVEDSLGAVGHLADQEKAESDLVDQAAQVLDVQRGRYNEGYTAYIDVLDAQRALFAARDQLNQTRLARLQAVVALYKALGGGWDLGQMQSDLSALADQD